MKGKSVKRIITRRVLPAVLAAAMVLGVAEWKNLRFTKANAATSLPGIENIRGSLLLADGSFRILEVVQDGYSGEFGYYIEGQEPDKFEDGLQEKNGREEREAWANDYLGKLEERGILSSNEDKAALYTTANSNLYTEFYPWEDVDSANTLTLKNKETVQLKGTVKRTDEGDFTPTSGSYDIVAKGEGDSAQNISADNPLDNPLVLFGTGDAGKKTLDESKDDYVFYRIDKLSGWTSINQFDVDDKLDKNVSIANQLIFTDDDNGRRVFDYAATADREFRYSGKYYICKDYTGLPEFGKDIPADETPESLAEAGYFAARIDSSDPFVADENGYFKAHISDLEYAGKGLGKYSIDFSGNSDISVTYSEVKYKGGYQNNNWFVRHVLDYDKDDPGIASVSSKISVETVSYDKMPADLSAYGLVVISGGYKEGAYGKVNSNVNLQNALQTYIGQKGAVLCDLSAVNYNWGFINALGLNWNQVNADRYPYGYVKGSVFAFRPYGDRKRVQTSFLNTDYPENQYRNNNSAFNEVYKDVTNQNFLRRKDGLSGNIRENINIATIIRYIISYRNSAARKAKESIRILDIEPEDSSDITDNNGKIKDQYLGDWFGNVYTKDKINVTTMSSRTLNGKIEDISENYDLVYIGAKTPLTNTVDPDMEGLVYYNIGDQVVFNNSGDVVTAGMMDDDFKNAPNSRQVYRSSGNDLTKKKKNELDSFISSGHPVIINDKLVSTETQPDFNATVRISQDAAEKYISGRLYVNTSVNQLEDLYSFDYQWYKWVDNKPQAIEGATQSSYTVPAADIKTNGSSMFFCAITGIYINGRTIAPDENQRCVSKAFWIGKNGDGSNWCNVKEEPGLFQTRETYSFTQSGFSYQTADKHKVDHYTRMYSLIEKNIADANVWSDTEVTADTQTLQQYLNISSPQIVFEKKPGTDIPDRPVAYSEGMNQADYLGKTLEMSFKVVNPTDSTPDSTTYTADIMFDTNGDGLFTDDEKAQDIFVASSDDDNNHVNTIMGGLNEAVAPGYSIAVTLPDDMIGAVNWKLVITQNPNDEYTDSSIMPHASFNEVSYKQRLKADGSGIEKQVINILQVNSDYQNGDTYNLEKAQLLYKNRSGDDGWSGNNDPGSNGWYKGTHIEKYGKWLNNSAVRSRYIVNIVTIKASDFNNMQYPNRDNDQNLLKEINNHKISSQPINLDDYDMLLFGFGDDYGTLNVDACKRIKAYAQEGKSVLFTHDNSNRKYIPSTKTGYKNDDWFNTFFPNNSGFKDASSRPFAFDTILRYIDKMDVYGITDSDIGSGGRSEWGIGGINNGFLTYKKQLTGDQIQKLENAGYSIAYKPDNNPDNLTDVVTVPETQGYSDFLLKRYVPLGRKADGNGYVTPNNHGSSVTTRVNELNRGTITSYPYDLNGVNWNRDDDVTNTHGQWYQLNMNSDDIVVWFTVENKTGQTYYKKNDAANSYYLFSCGNIYYTGAGHDINPTENEAKLFINMMIAAYRQGSSKPEAFFTSSAKSTKKANSYLMNIGDKTVTSVDVLRDYIEEITGIDTSKWSDSAFRDLKPCGDELGMTQVEIDLAAKAAATEMSYLIIDNDAFDNTINNRAVKAKNNADALKYGPSVDPDPHKNDVNINGVHIKYLDRQTTIDQICKGIDRIVRNSDNDNEPISGLSTDRTTIRQQKIYYTVRDNNSTKSKNITMKFYLYSKTKLDEVSDTIPVEENKNNDKGYYYDITKLVDIYEPSSDKKVEDAVPNYKANKVYSLKLNEDKDNRNPAITELVEKGTCVLALQPSVKVGTKDPVVGDVSKVTVNIAGLLSLG